MGFHAGLLMTISPPNSCVPGDRPASVVAVESRHDQLDEIQDWMLAVGEPLDLPLKHSFSGGIYARELFIPKGTLLTSYTHTTEHYCLCLMGKILVQGVTGEPRVFVGPELVPSYAGSRRIGYAYEDTIWVSFHAVGDEKDIEKIESEIYVEAKYLPKKEVAILPEETTGQSEVGAGQ